MKLSVVLIVKNEEQMLPGCLESLRDLGDELVVLDSGSIDGTVEIAKSFGARVEPFEWRDDFSAARNYAESCCQGEYIYWQDADEILVSGKEIIRQIVEEGVRDGVRPLMIFDRDSEGSPSRTYYRQELLHKRGNGWQWHGAAHEILTGGPQRSIEPGIIVEQLPRPGGDAPRFADPLVPLRTNLAQSLDERHLYYLAREHWYAGHWQEAIGLAALLLQQSPAWAIQRSDAAIIQGECYRQLGLVVEARNSFLRATQEWGAWAEPYFHLGCLHHDLGQWAEGAAWLYASLPFQPPDYFIDNAIYDWRRYDLLAVCLYHLGLAEEAVQFGRIALRVRPNDARLQENQRYYEGS